MTVVVFTEEQKQYLKKKFNGSQAGDWQTGHYLTEITDELAKMFGDKEVTVVLPYHGFYVKGPARKVYEDVYGAMPFSKAPREVYSTLFYPGQPVTRQVGVYLPFQADTDCFRVKEVTDNAVMLERDISWRAFI